MNAISAISPVNIPPLIPKEEKKHAPTFSLTFSAIQLIHKHQNEVSESFYADLFYQNVVDRIIGISFSILALVDVVYHLSQFAYKSIQVIYKNFTHDKPLNFEKAILHLKIASLFRFTIFFGSVTYFIFPSFSKNALTTHESAFVHALLLSSSPEVTEDFGSLGGTIRALSQFCNYFEQLPEKTQQRFHSINKLVSDARNLQTNLQSNESLHDFFLYESFYESVENYFHSLKKLESTEETKYTVFFQKEILSRLICIGLGVLSLPMAYLSLSAIFALSLGVSIALIKLLISNFPEDQSVKDFLLGCVYNLFHVLKGVVSLPLALTVGIFDPYKFQEHFASPFLKSVETFEKEAKTELLRKIKDLNAHESCLIPFSIYTNKEVTLAHACYLSITKLESNYRLSVINRGLGVEFHKSREKERKDGDASWDNVDFDFLKEYILLAFLFQDQKKAKEFYTQQHAEDRSEYLSWCACLYQLTLKSNTKYPRFESKHTRTTQKIGNCGVSSLLGAISFHESMRSGDYQNKKKYKEFIYLFKKFVYKKNLHLLDFDMVCTKKTEPLRSTVYKKLEAKRCKLLTIYR